MTCAGTSTSKILEEIHQLFHHLRHRSVEDLHARRVLDPLLHGVPQDPHLRQHLQQRCWPHPGGEVASVPVGRSAAHGPLPLCTGVCRLAPWGSVRSGPVRMVQPFMASPCTESSLPPPHRGSRRVANANHGRQHKGTAKITNTTEQPV